MSERLSVLVHLGAHKTATTYLQSRLFNSKKALAKNGIGYIKLSNLRRNVTAKLGKGKFSEAEISEFLKPHMNCRLLIISDENILGGTGPSRNGEFYPGCKERLERLLSVLGDCDLSVYLTVRNYQDYFISRYSESLRHFQFLNFEHYFKSFNLSSYAWPELVSDLAGVCGKGGFYCNSFDYFLKNEADYLSKWFGMPISLNDAELNPSVRRAKLSAEAYQVIQDFARKYSSNKTKELVRFLDEHPQDTEKHNFEPFSEVEKSWLSRKYSDDIGVVKSLIQSNWLG